MNGKQWTAVDETLKDSFPASDPPAWNQGRQQTADARKGRDAASRANRKPAKPAGKHKRIRIGPSDVS